MQDLLRRYGPVLTGFIILIVAFWLLVAVPLAWGVYHTLIQAAQLLG